jgi:hypothetical protein
VSTVRRFCLLDLNNCVCGHDASRGRGKDPARQDKDSRESPKRKKPVTGVVRMVSRAALRAEADPRHGVAPPNDHRAVVATLLAREQPQFAGSSAVGRPHQTPCMPFYSRAGTDSSNALLHPRA